jgi:hypothetical protein
VEKRTDYMKKILVILLLLSSTAWAVTGNQLKQWSVSHEGLFGGYIMGVVETLDAGVFCQPEGVTNGQQWDVVKKYIDDKPEELHHLGSIIVITALKKAFPCN